jgi:hypothetical protein
VTINGVKYSGSHLVWVLAKGCWPEEEIDHKDGNPMNNRIDNLRPATRIVNSRNLKLFKNNTSGHAGIQYKMSSKRWQVRAGKCHIGVYDTLEEAIKARKAAIKKLGYHSNHGKTR